MVGARLVTVIAGVWLVVAPAVLGHGGAAADNDRIVGPVVASLSFVAMWPVVAAVRWPVLLAGAWAVLAPLLLAYPLDAAVSSVVVGLLVSVLTPIGGGSPERFGGGWRSLGTVASPLVDEPQH